MKKESIMGGVIGLLVGVIITGFAAGQAVNNDNTRMMQMMGMDTKRSQQQTATSHDTMSMADMNKVLAGKTDDDFDKAFLEMMITHHQGAIDMANLAPTRAKHEEIKTLSQEIIKAQNKEITDMQQWQMDWGYMTSDNSMPGMNH